MIDKKRVRGLGTLLLETHFAGVVTRIDPSLFLESADEAYWVQEVVLRGLDPRRPVAWKISPPRDGGPPFGSPTPLMALQSSPAAFRSTHRVLGVEAEVAFRFGKTPKAKGKGADVAAAIDEAFVLIEFCETRFLNFEEVSPFTRIADFQSHGGFALGSGTAQWRELDFARQPVELLVNGKRVAAKAGSHPSGNLLEMAEWAVAHCAARGMPLAAGDVVTTGSWTGLTPIAFGDEVVARFEGIGEASMRLAPE